MRTRRDAPPPEEHAGGFKTWQTVAVVVVGVLLMVGVGVFLHLRQSSAVSRGLREHPEWADECGTYATSWVDGTVYVIGGHEWTHQFNQCLEQKAADQAP